MLEDECGTSGCCGGLEAGVYPFEKSISSLAGRGSDDESPCTVSVNDVGPQSAVGDLALDDVPRLCLLSQYGQAVVCQDESVESIDAVPWSCCRMGFFAVIFNLECGIRCCAEEGRIWRRAGV